MEVSRNARKFAKFRGSFQNLSERFRITLVFLNCVSKFINSFLNLYLPLTSLKFLEFARSSLNLLIGSWTYRFFFVAAVEMQR